jgi:hypothetical protein
MNGLISILMIQKPFIAEIKSGRDMLAINHPIHLFETNINIENISLLVMTIQRFTIIMRQKCIVWFQISKITLQIIPNL